MRLRDLRPISDATYSFIEYEPCVNGTREQILDRIMMWCKDPSPDSPSIFWLCGMAGTGKSTIAYTVCQKLYDTDDAAHRLGASFFCSRQSEASRKRQNVIPTIVHGLALSFPAFGRVVLDSKYDARPPPLPAHIRRMLVSPWKVAVSNNNAPSPPQLPPLVVVIDALDELEKGEGSAFLEELIKEFQRPDKGVPQGLKIFVTSRNDPRIVEVAASIHPKAIIPLEPAEEADTSSIEEDIHHYLQVKLPALSRDRLRKLARDASGLFIYAATAVRFIIPPSVPMPSIKSQMKSLEILLEGWPKRSQCGVDGLLVDCLYEEILSLWLFPMAEDNQAVALSVLQTVICAEEPLLICDIHQLLDTPQDVIDVEQVQSYILALHSVLYLSKGRVNSYHKSFIDFLFDNTRFGKRELALRICPTPQRQICLASACFQLMESLRFNICGLLTSYDDDSQVDDLQDRIHNNITSALRYACRHWAQHLSKTPAAARAKRMMTVFRKWLEESLLFWMEVMNLLQATGECYHMLEAARLSFATVSHISYCDVLCHLLNLLDYHPGGVEGPRCSRKLGNYIWNQYHRQVYSSSIYFCTCRFIRYVM